MGNQQLCEMGINFKEYICVDPYFFTREKRCKKLSSTLNDLRDKNSKFVIPSFFKETFRSAMGHGNYELRLADSDSSQNDREYMDDEVVKVLQELDGTFNTEKNNYHSFWKRIKDFVSEFSMDIIYSDELTAELLKNRSLPIKLTDIVKRLGTKTQQLGETIYHFVATCFGKNGIIVSYGEKLLRLMKKVGFAIFFGHSIFKHKMIEKGIAPQLLKISSVVFSAAVASQFSGEFSFVGIPADMFAIMPKAGLLIIGNGDTDDVFDVS